MQFSLATPEDSKKSLSNATRVKLHLSTGIVEILEKHQDLLGKIGIDLLEVEKTEENKFEKLRFVVQDALVIVSNKGFNTDLTPQTGVYIYAKRVIELTSTLSMDDLNKKLEQKILKLEAEKQRLNDLNDAITNPDEKIANSNKMKTKIFLLEEEVEFDKKVLAFIKSLRS
jgi:F0F1-type ATP synthase epsilon subunit